MDDKMDVCVHLVGEQPLPVYMGLKQFMAERNILVASMETRQVAERVAKLYGAESNAAVSVITTDPYNVQPIIADVERVLSEEKGRRIAFNLTGGTKPMFAAVFAVCARHKGLPFYVDTLNRCIRCLAPATDPVLPLQPWLNIETFIALSGFVVKDQGRWSDAPVRAERIDLTASLWEDAVSFNKLSVKVVPLANHPGKTFKISAGQYEASLDAQGTGHIQRGSESLDFPSMPDFGRYLAGGWFEEFCYMQLEPLVSAGRIKDLRIGLRPDWSAEKPTSGGAQDFDLVFTDGFKMCIGECKSGNVKQEDLQKLENNVGKFGGTMSQGVLLSVFPPFGSIEKRIRASSCISGFFGKAVTGKLPQMAGKLLPGYIHFDKNPGRQGGRRS